MELCIMEKLLMILEYFVPKSIYHLIQFFHKCLKYLEVLEGVIPKKF